MTVVASESSAVDVRSVPQRTRHQLIFATFRNLRVGESMELVNDHDPRPLYLQFQAERPGMVAWDYLENGPVIWRVRITRLAGGHDEGRCCGSCGGA